MAFETERGVDDPERATSETRSKSTIWKDTEKYVNKKAKTKTKRNTKTKIKTKTKRK